MTPLMAASMGLQGVSAVAGTLAKVTQKAERQRQRTVDNGVTIDSQTNEFIKDNPTSFTETYRPKSSFSDTMAKLSTITGVAGSLSGMASGFGSGQQAPIDKMTAKPIEQIPTLDKGIQISQNAPISGSAINPNNMISNENKWLNNPVMKQIQYPV